MSLGNDLYRGLGRLTARSLGSIDGVVGVYARRSVASREVAFGRSDIDLHLVIAPPASVEAEAELLVDLAGRLRLLRRAVPVLGHFDVSTRTELERWYTEQPAYWYRDRAWLRLWGEEFERPRTELEGERLDLLLWHFLELWGVFLWHLRAGDLRVCSNVFLDMFDMHRLHAEPSGEPLTRGQLVELWHAAGPPSRERDAIVRARRRRWRSHPREAVEHLFHEAMALHDLTCRDRSDAVDGLPAGRSLASGVPPGFYPRTYLVVDPQDRAAAESAIAAVRRDERVWPMTAASLTTYLTHRNPWERAPLVAANPGVALVEPSADAFRRSVRVVLYNEVARHFGLAGNHRLAGNVYAQRRLYMADGFVATSADELAHAYRARFGVLPRTDGTPIEYFRTHYPRIKGVIDELRVDLEA